MREPVDHSAAALEASKGLKQKEGRMMRRLGGGALLSECHGLPLNFSRATHLGRERSLI